MNPYRALLPIPMLLALICGPALAAAQSGRVPAEATPSAQAAFVDPRAIEPEMVRIEGGCFEMGSPSNEEGRLDDERAHRVCVVDFSMGNYEVTFEEYDRFARAAGRELPADDDTGRGRRPVIHVSWEDAMAYAEWLSRETGERYRLPTEAEWEYAARGGTTTPWFWGSDEREACQYANVYKNTFSCSSAYAYTAPVGSFGANPYGLHDMLGNVWEWTCSEYDQGYGGGELRCAGAGSGGLRSLRGGSWSGGPKLVRAATRFRGTPDYRGGVGFRLAQD